VAQKSEFKLISGNSSAAIQAELNALTLHNWRPILMDTAVGPGGGFIVFVMLERVVADSWTEQPPGEASSI
jgi:hypothetical protein